MKPRVCLVALVMVAAVGCGFESRVEGDWKLDPDTFSNKQLRKAGVPPEMMEGFTDGVFVVDSGVVYLGVVHNDTALLKYEIGKVTNDCAEVALKAEDTSGKQSEASIDACLDGDRLELSYDGDREEIKVTLDRVTR